VNFLLVNRLHKDENGASAVEFALLVPVLLLVLMGTVTLFDMFRTSQSVEKVTFTVGDILSRQTSISGATLTSMLSLVRNTVPTANDGGLRVSSISKKGNKFELLWSKTAGASAAIGTTAIPYDIVPDMANGDSVILTESFIPHSAMFAGFGVDLITFRARAVQRPRFVSSIAAQN
jgi:Flp pilus assembly pilin Flp